MHKKDNKTIASLKPRKQMGLKQIKLNNFLFKKTKYLSPNPQPQSSTQPPNNLRLRIKSQISQQLAHNQDNQHQQLNSVCTSMNMKTALSNKTSFLNKKDHRDVNLPNDLTFRILKLSKLKNRYQPGSKKSVYFEEAYFKKRKSLLLNQRSRDNSFKKKAFQQKPYLQSNNKYHNIHSKSVSYSSSRNQNIFHKKDEDTQRIFNNYKLTQRIVFFQQLQQKKDMQRHILASKKFQSSIRTKQKSNEQDSTQLKICRPWSGHSQKSNHSP